MAAPDDEACPQCDTEALYADPLIRAALVADGIPEVPADGAASGRVPWPVPMTPALVRDLYWGCGVSLGHIEILTGQAAQAVRGFMECAGIPLRPPGARSSFLWRSVAAAESVATPSPSRPGLWPVAW